LPVTAGIDTKVRLAVRRSDFSSDTVESVLQVTDGNGSRRLVPVSAQRIGAPASAPSLVAALTSSARPTGASASGVTGNATLPPGSLAGLWVGTADINQVSEAQAQFGSLTPKATKSTFAIRLLIHVDAANKARLLKEVIQMKKVLPDGGEQLALVTDDSLIPQFKGLSQRDGEPVGYRLSSAAIDFDSPNASNAIDLLGTFGPSGLLSTTLNLGANNPANPFRHKFHPDHDNLNRTFEVLPAGQEEAYPVKRIIELTFSPTDPSGNSNPAYGSSLLAGIYKETFGTSEVRSLPDPDGAGPLTAKSYNATVGGLHRNVIVVQGTFHLDRVSPIAELNK
jgi:hypothetical protein